MPVIEPHQIELARGLWRELSGSDDAAKLDEWMKRSFHVAELRSATPQIAQKAITALKNMVASRAVERELRWKRRRARERSGQYGRVVRGGYVRHDGSWWTSPDLRGRPGARVYLMQQPSDPERMALLDEDLRFFGFAARTKRMVAEVDATEEAA